MTAPAGFTHSLTLEFRRILSEAEWREVVEKARQLPYVQGLTANAVDASAPAGLRARAEALLAKITPGLWKDDRTLCNLIESEGTYVAEVISGNDADEEFIIAAPQLVRDLLAPMSAGLRELQEALRKALVSCEEYDNLDAAVDRIREAIRLAAALDGQGDAVALPGPSCLKCGERMKRQSGVVFTDDATGLSLTMSKAFVCQCGYQTIAGSQMGEFQNRMLKAELDKAKAELASLKAAGDAAPLSGRVEKGQPVKYETHRLAVRKLEQMHADIEKAWQMLENCYDVEPREYFEREARRNGFDSPLAQAIFHVHKRDKREAAGDAAPRVAPSELWPYVEGLERACWKRKWSEVKAARKALSRFLGQACEGSCNPYVANCGAGFCADEERMEHNRSCSATSGSGDEAQMKEKDKG